MTTKIYLINLLTALLILPAITFAQGVSINTDDSEADPSAMLDIKSNNKGLLIPRMTQSEIESIANPANGLWAFNTTENKFYVYTANENEWKELAFGSSTIAGPFTCGDPLIDSRDGKAYNSVQIGTQCWMVENLNIGTMINGSNNQTDNGTIEKYCYNNGITNCDTYGGLYQWDEMMEYITTEGTQGICPDGWHVPTDNEFKTLEMHLGMTQTQADATGFRGTNEGSKLAGNKPLWADGNLDNNQDFGNSGFMGLPGGDRLQGSQFINLAYGAFYWTSNENGSNAFERYLYFTETQIYRGSFRSKIHGFSVRCIKD